MGVLREGVGRDRLAAIFAIGHSALPQAVELLVPLLQSSEQLERCAAACCLGLRRDERAITVLEEYLLHEPPTDSSGRPVPGAEYWYQSYRGLIALLLATWGPPSIGPVLRQCFLHLWEKEQRGSRSSREYDTHDALLYALGRRGALAALHGITLPPPRWRLAILCLALGYLRAYERFTHLYHEMIVNRTLEQEVTSVLTEQFALSEQECQEVLNAWGEDIWNRRHWSEQEEEDAQENTEESSS